MPQRREAEKKKLTPMFKSYAAQLVFRLVLFVIAILVFIFDPIQLSISSSFGFAHGFSLVDFIFIVLIADMLTKLFPNAKIAVGSLKQYRQFHVPTAALFKNGKEGIVAYGREVIAQGRLAMKHLPKKMRAYWEETLEGLGGAKDSITYLLSDFKFFKLLPFKDSQLVAPLTLREQIRHDRLREIIPVLIFWVIFNVAIFVALTLIGIFSEQVALIWVLFYFVFDMICVVLWCPLQVVFMKNRCCTTCQIFNWDAAMTATPLFFIVWVLSAAWFTWPVILLALFVVVRWELAFVRHPERFDERTNASLSCCNCPDKLCVIREPLLKKLKTIPDSIKTATPPSDKHTFKDNEL